MPAVGNDAPLAEVAVKLEFFERKFFDLADQLRFFIAQEQFFFVAETFGWSGCLSYGRHGLILV